MKKMYVIQWKSKVNGRAGRGTKLFEKEEAGRLAEELNHEYPDIQHEAIEAPVHAEEPALPVGNVMFSLA
jgi:hypothetical protein